MDTDTKEQLELLETKLIRIKVELGEINQGLREVSDLILLQTALQADLYAPDIRDYVATRATGILREKKRAGAAFQRRARRFVGVAVFDKEDKAKPAEG